MKKLKMLSFMLACALFSSQTYSTTEDSNSKETKELVEYVIGCVPYLKYKIQYAEHEDLANHEEFMHYINSFVEQNKSSLEKLKHTTEQTR